MKKNYKKFIALLSIVFIIIFVRFLNVHQYLNLEMLKANREYLLIIVHNHYWLSVFIYLILYISIVILSLPLAAPLTMISGFLFGTIAGVLYTNIGATIGASLTFLIFRYFLGDFIQETYADALEAFNKNLELYGIYYLLIVRFIAFIPFFIVNILASLTKIRLKEFIWTTSLGIIPGSIVYVYAGKHIGKINSLSDVFSFDLVVAFLALILLGIFPMLIKNIKITTKNGDKKRVFFVLKKLRSK